MTLLIEHPPEWHERRRLAIGGSEAPILMGGDLDRIEQLRLVKLGRAESKAILGPWALALRRVTEVLQMDWYEHTTGRAVERSKYVTSPQYPFMAAELDGYIPAINAVIDAKHLDGFLKEPIEWAKEHYAWQVVHQMVVANADLGLLSIIHGSKEPQLVEYEFDPFAADSLIERCEWFWKHVTEDRPIEGSTLSAPPAAPEAKPDPARIVDMAGNNEWGDRAATWLETRKPAKKFEAAVKDLKALVEPDVKRAFGGGVEITRSKSGALSIKEV